MALPHAALLLAVVALAAQFHVGECGILDEVESVLSVADTSQEQCDALITDGCPAGGWEDATSQPRETFEGGANGKEMVVEKRLCKCSTGCDCSHKGFPGVCIATAFCSRNSDAAFASTHFRVYEDEKAELAKKAEEGRSSTKALGESLESRSFIKNQEAAYEWTPSCEARKLPEDEIGANWNTKTRMGQCPVHWEVPEGHDVVGCGEEKLDCAAIQKEMEELIAPLMTDVCADKEGWRMAWEKNGKTIKDGPELNDKKWYYPKFGVTKSSVRGSSLFSFWLGCNRKKYKKHCNYNRTKKGWTKYYPHSFLFKIGTRNDKATASTPLVYGAGAFRERLTTGRKTIVIGEGCPSFAELDAAMRKAVASARFRVAESELQNLNKGN